MALTLNATAADASANAYLTVASAVAYFEGRFDATNFTSCTSTTSQSMALVMATTRLDQERFYGVPTYSTQALQWPRSGVLDPRFAEGTAFDPGWGLCYDGDTIPTPIKNATCELALALLQDVTLLRDSGLEGYDEVSVGGVVVKPFKGHKAGDLPYAAQRELRGLRSQSPGSKEIVRG